MQPSLQIEESYDSNFFSMGSAGNPDDTFVTTTTPALRLSYTRKHFSFDIYYGHHFRYLSRTSDTTDDGENRSTLALEVPLSENTAVSVNDIFSFVDDSGAATGNDAVTGIQTERTERISNTFSIVANHAFTPQTTATLSLSDASEILLNSTLIDSRTDSAALAINHQLSDRTSVDMTYGYSLFTFDDGGSETDTESHSFHVGLSEQVSPTFSMNLSGGASYTLDVNDSYDVTGQAGLAKTFQRSSFSLSYSRALTHSSGLIAEVSLSDSVSARWSYTATNTVELGIYGTYSKEESESTGSVDTDSYTAGLDGTWRPYSWLTLSAGYSHLQQWSAGTIGLDLSRDQATVTATVTPAGWSL
ncbi:MAG: hypothetical protein ACE5D4_09970 [Thermodesulfobacteriota bacterium]